MAVSQSVIQAKEHRDIVYFL